MERVKVWRPGQNDMVWDLGGYIPARARGTERERERERALGPSFQEHGKSQVWTPTRHEVSVREVQLEDTVSSRGGSAPWCLGM